ncbi:MAG: transcriptional regulator [Rhodothermales bacterium]|nr:transcriptional regulator [Rhodothermales bacterium]
MANYSNLQHLKLCLIAEDEAVVTSVRIACPPPHVVSSFAVSGLVDNKNALSDFGKSVVQEVSNSDALLISWDMDLAPIINTVSYHIHKSSLAPVIALCGGNPDDQVSALAAGVDATLTFPLYLPLVHFKIAAYKRTVNEVLNRGISRGGQKLSTDGKTSGLMEVQHFGKIRLDSRERRLFIESKEVPLTAREFALLSYMIENAGAACSRNDILESVWGITFDTGTNMVDVYMYFLRKKLDAHGLKEMIETVRGHGYRLMLDQAETDFN